ncbi:MAG: hypothetical protein ACXVZH_03445 [Terriglobales bacterium]
MNSPLRFQSGPFPNGNWNTKPPYRNLTAGLFKRIEVAEAAVLTRREVLVQSPDGFAERQEIKLALDQLRRLKKEVLKFS